MYNNKIVTIKVKYAGICGSDINKLKFEDMDLYRINKLGHEVVGEFKDIKTGNVKECVVNPFICKDNCEYCNETSNLFCKKCNRLGDGISQGAFSGIVSIPEKNILAIPECKHPEVGIFTDGVAVLFHSLHMLIGEYKKILIIGDGTIGIVGALLLSERFPKALINIIIKRQEKMNIINALGINNISYIPIEQFEDYEESYDLVVETVGGNQTNSLTTAINSVKKTGNIMVIGAFNNSVKEIIGIRKLFYKQITLFGVNSFCEKEDDFRKAFYWTYKNEDILYRVITDRYRINSSTVTNIELKKDILRKKLVKGIFEFE